MKPHVLYIGAFAHKTGYAQAAHDYMLALHRAGVRLTIQPVVECNTDDLEDRYEELIDLATGTVAVDDPFTHVIVHTVPAHAWRYAERFGSDVTKIAITTWETHCLPDEIGLSLDKYFDLVIVPSRFCADAMTTTRDSLKDKVVIVPHTFDPTHWPTQECPPPDSPFTFYSLLGWSERKNPIGLLKAYLAEFTNRDDVLLRLKVSGFSPDDLDSLTQACGLPADELPAIDIVTDYLDHEDVIGLHYDGHCFVTAARGEGWNLPAFEAAAIGKPVISPTFGGQMDFLDGYCNAFPVSFQLTPAISPPQVEPPVEIAGVRVRAVKSNKPSGITARQYWAEPSLWDLAKTMRACYERRARTNSADRRRFEQSYGYATIGARLIELLNSKGQTR
jgi:glycosyltransferase involved in cell wall biosynthesis